MRTFHIGGAASQRAAESTLENIHEGVIKFSGIRTVEGKDGSLVVVNRTGTLIILDDKGYERERYPLALGAKLKVAEGEKVKEGHLIAEWDPYTTPFISEFNGTVGFVDLEPGITLKEQVDEVTGIYKKVVIETKNLDVHPGLVIKTDEGKNIQYSLPIGAIIEVNEGDEVSAGDIFAKIARATAKTKDITGGLPRVAELFEARLPKDLAVLTEIDGIVSYGKDVKGKRRVLRESSLR
jgi:DNA-directed RNA polymerase subunit beta'